MLPGYVLPNNLVYAFFSSSWYLNSRMTEKKIHDVIYTRWATVSIHQAQTTQFQTGRYSVHAVSSEMHPQGKVNPKMQEAKMMELWETDPTPGSPESIPQGFGGLAL